MKIIITNLPSFYKIKLYNQINKKCELLVIYTETDSHDRNGDFFKGEMQFKHLFLRGNTLQKMWKVFFLLQKITYSELIIGGWDAAVMWEAALCSPKYKNSVVVESSLKDSVTTGFKGFIKRFFVSRIAKSYVSGKSQCELMTTLGFHGKMIVTKGVGVFNYIAQPPYEFRNEVRKFLFVGRLISAKNLKYLIEKFNKHPELELNIIGFGELEQELKAMAVSNTHFLGAINNKELTQYYQEADVFILPSLSEPWGLVVEEALNSGTPVMLSNKVGCIDEIINENNGVVFSLDKDDFEEKLIEIRNLEKYNAMRKFISKMNYQLVEEEQVNCYLA